jgi:hypothetical protein
MTIGTSVSFGLLLAIAFSMKDFLGGNAAFEFSTWTVVGFLLGGFAGWAFWRVIHYRMRKVESGEEQGSIDEK